MSGPRALYVSVLTVQPVVKEIRKIDFIHQAISLPGIAMRVCFDSVTDPKAEFHLFNNKNNDIYKLVRVPNFWGMSGSEDRGGSDSSIQFINFGRVGDKSFKEWRQKIGRWKGG